MLCGGVEGARKGVLFGKRGTVFPFGKGCKKKETVVKYWQGVADTAARSGMLSLLAVQYATQRW